MANPETQIEAEDAELNGGSRLVQRLVGHRGRVCIDCGEPDKCLIMKQCLRQWEREQYFRKYGRMPNVTSEQQPHKGEPHAN